MQFWWIPMRWPIVSLVKSSTRFPAIANDPNVSDITLIAKSVEKNGANAITLINTLAGMAIDIETQKTKLEISMEAFPARPSNLLPSRWCGMSIGRLGFQ
jgi:hypothetical protein